MDNKLIPLAITLMVGIILAGSVLAPVIDDARTNAGEEIIKTNLGSSTYQGTMDWTNNATITVEGKTVKCNGVVADFNGSATYNRLIVADRVYINYAQSGDVIQIISANPATDQGWSTTNYTLNDGSSGTITINEGATTIALENVTSSGPQSDVLPITHKFMCFAGLEGGYMEVGPQTISRHVFVKSLDEIAFCGIYSTGENDTFYSWFNQNGYTSKEFEIESLYVSVRAEGTTDLLDVTNLGLSVGGEEFYPYQVFIPVSVTGHLASGSAYNLYGVIPVMVIVALLLFAVQAIRMRND